MKNLTLILALVVAFTACKKDKSINRNSEKIKLVDSLLERPNKIAPGYALGIIENGELILAKGYGYSNLEHELPLSDSSAIYIGSMAKQFTTAALLILESQGKIDFDEPVNKYLPDFPTYDQPININHLIHHTSGIRETNSMQLFQGIDLKFEEYFDTDDLYQLIVKQEELNFQPGREFRYSSGGYAVLAKVVEHISGQDFRTFTKENIFDPLEMKNTLVSDDHNEIIRNRSASYWPIEENKYERRSLIFDAYGDGGIITTVKDLAKWDKAFYQDILGVDNFADKMYQKGKLNNGEEIEYARALQVRNYKGLTMITHNGGMLGFRVDMVRFPEIKTSFILLGNSAFLDPTGDILKISDIWIEEKLTEEKDLITYQQNESRAIMLKSDDLQKYEGYYWTDQSNYYRRITYRNDSLFLDSGNPDYGTYLSPISENTFELKDYYVPAKLTFSPETTSQELTAQFGQVERTFRKFDPTPPADLADLRIYNGIYHSAELSTNYEIFEKSNAIHLKIGNNKSFQIFPVSENSRVVWNGKKMVWLGFGEVKFNFNNENQVTGLTIGDGRVSGVKFPKE
ncbi:MAG: beta-lactamase family protein [Cyclobacteriaceae bacterium]